MEKTNWDRTSVKEAIATGTWESTPLTDVEMFSIFDIDPEIWKVKKRTANTWGKQFQTKLWLERIEGAFETISAVSLLDKWEREGHSPINPPKIDCSKNERLLEIFLTDCHFDKLTWAQESGDNYNIKIAREIFLDATATLLNKAVILGFDRVLFVIGSDLFNSEGKRATTTKGTPQTVDVRWQKSFDYVSETVRDSIELCAQHAVVDVLVIPGNHDCERSYYLGAVIEAWFSGDPRISVDNSPTSRKYYVHGKNLLMFDHGHIDKGEYGMIMATERKEDWARTDKRFVHVGHLHSHKKMQQVVDEKYGVEVETFPSFSGTCGWHFDNGYIGNQKRASAKIFDTENGLEYEINYFVPRKYYKGK